MTRAKYPSRGHPASGTLVGEWVPPSGLGRGLLLATQLEEEAPLALVRPGFGARRESGSQGVLFA